MNLLFLSASFFNTSLITKLIFSLSFTSFTSFQDNFYFPQMFYYPFFICFYFVLFPLSPAAVLFRPLFLFHIALRFFFVSSSSNYHCHSSLHRSFPFLLSSVVNFLHDTPLFHTLGQLNLKICPFLVHLS